MEDEEILSQKGQGKEMLYTSRRVFGEEWKARCHPKKPRARRNLRFGGGIPVFIFKERAETTLTIVYEGISG
jgi:hypothetical protein